MIHESISKGKYVKIVDTTHKGLKYFQDFLNKQMKYYDDIIPISNQPAHSESSLKRMDLIPLKILMSPI